MEKDILIIGGGPGGLSTALHLANLAPPLTSRILILEKEHYPRLKLCAGGLVIDAEIILERLGLDVREVPHVDARTARFDFAGKGLTVRVPKRHAIRIIRRDEFDHWLAKKVESRGIEIRKGVTVKNVQPLEDRVIVETDQGDFHAAIVVGADGSNGITRRCIFPNEPAHTARVLEVITPDYPVIASPGGASGEASPWRHGDTIPSLELKVAPGDFDTPRENRARLLNHPRSDAAFFDFFPIPENIAGYVWDFPTQVEGEPMRCWGIYDTNLLADKKRPALKEPLAEEMKRLGFNLNDYEIKGHPIRWYSPWNKVSVPRVLLVGDAVGADPLFGEGISMALGFGALAAQEIAESFQRGEFSFSGYKRRLGRSGLGQTLFARWVITQVIYSFKWKWFQILLWRIMKPIVLLGAWIFVLNWSRRSFPATVSRA
jgi:flavin-dependent dehydrogenase